MDVGVIIAIIGILVAIVEGFFLIKGKLIESKDKDKELDFKREQATLEREERKEEKDDKVFEALGKLEEVLEYMKKFDEDLSLNTQATKILLRDMLRSVALFWKEGDGKDKRMPQLVKDEWLRSYTVYMGMVGENGYIEAFCDWVKKQ